MGMFFEQRGLFTKIFRIIWIAAGLFFMLNDIIASGNTTLRPTFWILFGVFCIGCALLGLAGGIGAMLLSSGALHYRANMIITGDAPVFAEGFSNFDKFAQAFFIFYGIFLLYRQINKNIRRKSGA